jgi:hypothetical protein
MTGRRESQPAGDHDSRNRYALRRLITSVRPAPSASGRLPGGRRMRQGAGGYHHTEADSDETAEYVVPVDWISTRTREQAIRQKGLFANQNSACKMRNWFTLDVLYSAFGLDDTDPGGVDNRNAALPPPTNA